MDEYLLYLSPAEAKLCCVCFDDCNKHAELETEESRRFLGKMFARTGFSAVRLQPPCGDTDFEVALWGIKPFEYGE